MISFSEILLHLSNCQSAKMHPIGVYGNMLSYLLLSFLWIVFNHTLLSNLKVLRHKQNWYSSLRLHASPIQTPCKLFYISLIYLFIVIGFELPIKPNNKGCIPNFHPQWCLRYSMRFQSPVRGQIPHHSTSGNTAARQLSQHEVQSLVPSGQTLKARSCSINSGRSRQRSEAILGRNQWPKQS